MAKRTIETRDLVGCSEIATKAGVSKPAVINWANRYSDFPRPLATLGCGPIFLWSEVKQWLVATGRNKRKVVA